MSRHYENKLFSLIIPQTTNSLMQDPSPVVITGHDTSCFGQKHFPYFNYLYGAPDIEFLTSLVMTL